MRFLFLLLFLVLASCSSSPIDKQIPYKTSVSSPGFREEMGALLTGHFIDGNAITTLENGDEIFPSMLKAIASAKHSITFETYIFSNDEISQKFADAFIAQAKKGVKVHIILDAYGASEGRSLRRKLTEAGAIVATYNPRFIFDPRRHNNRTHRKLLVIDGKVGFIGGVGIREEWLGNASTPKEWRELHYKVEGPVVSQLQGAFANTWLQLREEVLHGPEYFPALPARGNLVAGAFYASPKTGNYRVSVLYHTLLASAKRNIRIISPYFLPNSELREALFSARKRGVRVQLIFPGRHMDMKFVRLASRAHWEEYLEAGMEIYEYQPTMIHSKLIIVDDLFVSVGSANWDSRSLALNDEANLNVLDKKFAAEQIRIFEKDRSHSTPVTLDGHRSKALMEKPAQIAQTPVNSQL